MLTVGLEPVLFVSEGYF